MRVRFSSPAPQQDPCRLALCTAPGSKMTRRLGAWALYGPHLLEFTFRSGTATHPRSRDPARPSRAGRTVQHACCRGPCGASARGCWRRLPPANSARCRFIASTSIAGRATIRTPAADFGRASDPPPVSELGELSRDPDPSRIEVQIAAPDGHELTPPEWLRWQPKPSVSLAVETLASKAPRELAAWQLILGVCSDENFWGRGRWRRFPRALGVGKGSVLGKCFPAGMSLAAGMSSAADTGCRQAG